MPIGTKSDDYDASNFLGNGKLGTNTAVKSPYQTGDEKAFFLKDLLPGYSDVDNSEVGNLSSTSSGINNTHLNANIINASLNR